MFVSFSMEIHYVAFINGIKYERDKEYGIEQEENIAGERQVQ